MLKVVLPAIGFFVFISGASATTWVGPLQTAPLGNVPPPLNVNTQFNGDVTGTYNNLKVSSISLGLLGVLQNNPDASKFSGNAIFGGGLMLETSGNWYSGANSSLSIGHEASPTTTKSINIKQTSFNSSGSSYGVYSQRYQNDFDNPTGSIFGVLGDGGKYNANILSAYGVAGRVESWGGGSITNAYSLYAFNPIDKHIANSYGLFIENITNGTSLNYAIYSAGGDNYFGGDVGIGTTSTNVKLVVGNGAGDGNIIGINGADDKYTGLRLNVANGEKWFVGMDSTVNDNDLLISRNGHATNTDNNVRIVNTAGAPSFIQVTNKNNAAGFSVTDYASGYSNQRAISSAAIGGGWSGYFILGKGLYTDKLCLGSNTDPNACKTSWPTGSGSNATPTLAQVLNEGSDAIGYTGNTVLGGNLGVGAAQPGGILHAVSSIVNSTALFEKSGEASDALRVAARLLTTKTTAAGNGLGSAVGFYIDDSVLTAPSYIGSIGAVMANGIKNTGNLIFRTVNNGTQSVSMVINYLGNVGIGTETPDVKLVIGNGVAGGNMVGINGANSDYVGTRIAIAGIEKWFSGRNNGGNFVIRADGSNTATAKDFLSISTDGESTFTGTVYSDSMHTSSSSEFNSVAGRLVVGIHKDFEDYGVNDSKKATLYSYNNKQQGTGNNVQQSTAIFGKSVNGWAGYFTGGKGFYANRICLGGETAADCKTAWPSGSASQTYATPTLAQVLNEGSQAKSYIGGVSIGDKDIIPAGNITWLDVGGAITGKFLHAVGNGFSSMAGRLVVGITQSQEADSTFLNSKGANFYSYNDSDVSTIANNKQQATAVFALSMKGNAGYFVNYGTDQSAIFAQNASINNTKFSIEAQNHSSQSSAAAIAGSSIGNATGIKGYSQGGWAGYFTGGKGVYASKLCLGGESAADCQTSWPSGSASQTYATPTLAQVLKAGPDASSYNSGVVIGSSSSAWLNVGGAITGSWLHATAAGDNSIAGNLAISGKVGIGTTPTQSSPVLTIVADPNIDSALSVGQNNTVNGRGAIGLGQNNAASNINAIAIGTGAEAKTSHSIAIGNNVVTDVKPGPTNGYSMALGNNINVKGFQSIGIGLGASTDDIYQNNFMSIMGGKVGIGSVSSNGNVKLTVGDGTGTGNIISLNGAAGEYVGNKIAVAGTEKWFSGKNDAGNFVVRSDGSAANAKDVLMAQAVSLSSMKYNGGITVKGGLLLNGVNSVGTEAKWLVGNFDNGTSASQDFWIGNFNSAGAGLPAMSIGSSNNQTTFYGKIIANNGFQLNNGAAAGKILTSDASGNASWQSPAAAVTPNLAEVLAKNNGDATSYSGNVNIGQDVSGKHANLFVNGGQITGKWIWATSNNPAEYSFIGHSLKVGGNIGIGFANALGNPVPTEKLDIAGTAASGEGARIVNAFVGEWPSNSNFAVFMNADLKATPNAHALLQGNDGQTYLNSAFGQPIHFRNYNEEKMTMTNVGRFGIGTTSPNSLLHVYGVSGNNAEIDLQSIAGAGNHWGIYQQRTDDVATAGYDDTGDLRFWQGSNRVVFSDSGNVGIGNISPQTKLQVQLASASKSWSPTANVDVALFENSGNTAIQILTGAQSFGSVQFSTPGEKNAANIGYNANTDVLSLSVGQSGKIFVSTAQANLLGNVFANATTSDIALTVGDGLPGGDIININGVAGDYVGTKISNGTSEKWFVGQGGVSGQQGSGIDNNANNFVIRSGNNTDILAIRNNASEVKIYKDLNVVGDINASDVVSSSNVITNDLKLNTTSTNMTCNSTNEGKIWYYKPIGVGATGHFYGCIYNYATQNYERKTLDI